MEIQIPSLLRIKPGCFEKLGKYLKTAGFERAAVFYGDGLQTLFAERVRRRLTEEQVELSLETSITNNEISEIVDALHRFPQSIDVIVAIGGGKVIDYCKYLAFLRHIPIIAVPTALSNDGMASPGVSLQIGGRRKSLLAKTPYGVVIDTAIVQSSPVQYTYSGIGDMVAKLTATCDWKLAFHAVKEPVNDFAVLISHQSIENLLRAPHLDPRDPDFIRRLAGGLVMSGVAMEVSGSSRPASGSEHLVSHAYDLLAKRPHLHGIQVGIATYAVSWLQDKRSHSTIAEFFEKTGFFRFVETAPLDRSDFIAAIRESIKIKENFHTVLSSAPDAIDRLIDFIQSDSRLKNLLR